MADIPSGSILTAFDDIEAICRRRQLPMSIWGSTYFDPFAAQFGPYPVEEYPGMIWDLMSINMPECIDELKAHGATEEQIINALRNSPELQQAAESYGRTKRDKDVREYYIATLKLNEKESADLRPILDKVGTCKDPVVYEGASIDRMETGGIELTLSLEIMLKRGYPLANSMYERLRGEGARLPIRVKLFLNEAGIAGFSAEIEQELAGIAREGKGITGYDELLKELQSLRIFTGNIGDTLVNNSQLLWPELSGWLRNIFTRIKNGLSQEP